MAFPQLSASMLLASFLLLYWTTSSAESHDPTSSVLSPPSRVKREMPLDTREKVEKSLAVGNHVLTVIKEVVGKMNTKKLSAVMKSLQLGAQHWSYGRLFCQ
ncbi:hypothetical protein PFLUV_G00184810 [Perca fluviatilis]|uniref:Uncharacterized protein n=1 Tax=Perca fluviatilis TaxID=8168 RepID=A0A6A5EW20_PERFL|nr:hypothetical protein PFLUV_G00184810 [Perca fluviatilis]